jgi:hypothetical protein
MTNQNQANQVASYAIGRAYRANRMQRKPLSLVDLKTKIGNHLSGRHEWPAFRGYMHEGVAAVSSK